MGQGGSIEEDILEDNQGVIPEDNLGDILEDSLGGILEEDIPENLEDILEGRINQVFQEDLGQIIQVTNQITMMSIKTFLFQHKILVLETNPSILTLMASDNQ